jgi:solute carrier family 25 carnitine/acylcarnitine transporter 20/29
MGDCLRQSVRANGVLGGPLQGFSATLLRNIPAAGVYFGTFETLKLRLPALTGETQPRMVHLFAAGGSAGFLYWALFYPLDVLKSALQTDALVASERRFAGVADAARQLWAEGGPQRFYKGVTPCLIRAIPANAIMLIANVRPLGPGWRARRSDIASPRMPNRRK